jgi:ATP-dependent exoDNAse (exonuclease V) alpha subunit
VASYHLSVKPVSRARGRSAPAAAAYRAADRIRDERTGELFDFRRKRGVEYREILLPAAAPSWAGQREALWNAAEAAERRKNSTVAREFEIALPSELTPAQRRELAVRFARELVTRHGFAADVCLHKPGRGGDRRNHHAHILCSTRRLGPDGFNDKTRELDDLKRGPAEVTRWRERWAELQNELLKEHGLSARVDHRSLEAQGLARAPTHHKGPAITALERRGIETRVGWRFAEEQRREMQARLERGAELGRLEREHRELSRSILDLSGDIAQARRQRDLAHPIEHSSSLASPEATPAKEEGRGLTAADRLRRIVEERAPVRDAGRSPERLSLEEIGRREIEKQGRLDRERQAERQRALESERERERENQKDRDPGLEL